MEQQMEWEEEAVEEIIYYTGVILSLENQVGQEEGAIELRNQIHEKVLKSCLVESDQCCILHFLTLT